MLRSASASTTKGWEDTFDPSSGIHIVIQPTEVKEANRIPVQIQELRKINAQMKMAVQIQLKSQATTTSISHLNFQRLRSENKDLRGQICDTRT